MRNENETVASKPCRSYTPGVYSSLTNFQAIIHGLPLTSFRPLSGCKYPAQVDWGQLATTVKSLICFSVSAAKRMLMWQEKVSIFFQMFPLGMS